VTTTASHGGKQPWTANRRMLGPGRRCNSRGTADWRGQHWGGMAWLAMRGRLTFGSQRSRRAADWAWMERRRILKHGNRCAPSLQLRYPVVVVVVDRWAVDRPISAVGARHLGVRPGGQRHLWHSSRDDKTSSLLVCRQTIESCGTGGDIMRLWTGISEVSPKLLGQGYTESDALSGQKVEIAEVAQLHTTPN
jgi:hypothetical protein